MENREKERKWYSVDATHVLNDLETNSTDGLSSQEVTNRLEQHGKNKLTESKKESNLQKFFKQFHDTLIYVLLTAALVTILLEQYIDTAVIALVVIINAFIGYIQENKAEKALDAIKGMLSLHANVIRDGKRSKVNAENVVQGDIVLLNAGDKIPADLRLIECHNLTVEESALTGESLSVEKKTYPLQEDTMLGDRINMAFSGTSISSGTGIGIVVATGDDTELGKINQSIDNVQEIKTPLLQQTEKFGKQISVAIVTIGIVMFVFAMMIRDYQIGELMLAIIAMIVAAIPEGLPAIMSIILAIGVQNMANRRAIVRNLPSVETLGAVSVICSDKTGTLTKNEMTVRSIITKNNSFEVTGLGYAPKGQILKSGTEADLAEDEQLKRLLLTFKTVNDATLTRDKQERWTINGEPTDGSLITLTEKANKPLDDLNIEAKIPFDSEYKYMAVLTTINDQKYILIKGAPDRLFDMADLEMEPHSPDTIPFDKAAWEERMLYLAKKGERIIGAAFKKVPNEKDTLDHDDLKGNIVFLGMAGIIDPPREEAIQAVEESRQAGITVKMITGDHPETAYAIGKQLGIGNGHGALEGKDIDGMSKDALAEAVKKYDIFARTSPHNKLQLVNALQKNGEITSMTGDGVNDAPSLKKADIGVAMGIKGTEVAKDASKMILVDDNFKTIVNAVEEGRRVYDNLKKTILFILPTNGAEALLVAGAILLGVSMPLTPVQILWVNMITAVTVALALAFEKLEPGSMQRPPRPKKTHLLNGYYLFRITYVSLIVGLACLYIFIDMINQGYGHAVVNTIILNAIVFSEMFYLFNARSEKEPAFNNDFFSNKVAFAVSGLLILFQLGVTYLPVLNIALGTAPMTLEQWLIPIILGSVVFVIVEIEKVISKKLAS
ncbi:cation-transporting P-type ATPase [Aquibacillus sediminis]|uniref:cation-transporting P-type ATPase n=1 Tax=Aquibacillus sediminis TaxID=2574734 RepID=UPI0011089E18|nr:cation-transporting P-type ATPase [Aquibacillus sediminis]